MLHLYFDLETHCIGIFCGDWHTFPEEGFDSTSRKILQEVVIMHLQPALEIFHLGTTYAGFLWPLASRLPRMMSSRFMSYCDCDGFNKDCCRLNLSVLSVEYPTFLCTNYVSIPLYRRSMSVRLRLIPEKEKEGRPFLPNSSSWHAIHLSIDLIADRAMIACRNGRHEPLSQNHSLLPLLFLPPWQVSRKPLTTMAHGFLRGFWDP